ncbi:hypothetical protein IIC44_02410, partial [Patescibacteria group bacterium]|nr:hypothetical protein [Patescibacteria group bacterium]
MKQKIVIIESDRLIADVLADRLSREEYVVYSAKDRVRGERLVREKLPSLVLLDISKQSEMEFLQDFSDDAVLRRIPVIAILDFGKKEKIKKSSSSTKKLEYEIEKACNEVIKYKRKKIDLKLVREFYLEYAELGSVKQVCKKHPWVDEDKIRRHLQTPERLPK